MESISNSMMSLTNTSPAIAPARPTLAVKQVEGDVDSLGQPQRLPTLGLVTRKEWVIPPRPKPGRKPATDTPPTKRKAQNRAAQRAFRERRAARVGELEEKLGEVKEEHQRRETSLRNKIKQLEAEVERLKMELDSWKIRCSNMDTMLGYEKGAKESAIAELEYLQKGAKMNGTDTVPLPSRDLGRLKTEPQHVQPDPAPDFTPHIGACGIYPSKSERLSIEDTFTNSDMGCGNCTLSGSCACLEETLGSLKANLGSKLKGPLIQSSSLAEKQSLQSNKCTPLETDFTSHISVKPMIMESEPIEQILPTESCGFCEEGTYCLCAEAVKAATISNSEQRDIRHVPYMSDIASAASEIDFTTPKHGSYQNTSTKQDMGCVNGPGTCQQCQKDPRSGDFCRSLSALKGLGTKLPEVCCGNTNGGGCCKSITTAPLELPPRLTCADAYKTLSNHKHYDRANNELSTWLGCLNATPPSHPGRGPLEVEAASVMGVLRLFDRRFGRD